MAYNRQSSCKVGKSKETDRERDKEIGFINQSIIGNREYKWVYTLPDRVVVVIVVVVVVVVSLFVCLFVCLFCKDCKRGFGCSGLAGRIRNTVNELIV